MGSPHGIRSKFLDLKTVCLLHVCYNLGQLPLYIQVSMLTNRHNAMIIIIRLQYRTAVFIDRNLIHHNYHSAYVYVSLDDIFNTSRDSSQKSYIKVDCQLRL